MRHVIPKNVSSDGGIAGGAIKQRNAVEAGIYIFVCFLVFKSILFFLPIIAKLITFTIVGIMPAAVMLIGIADQSAVEFVTTKLRYMRRKDIIPYVIQTENIEDDPKTLVEKYQRKFDAKSKKKEEKQEQYIRELEFVINDPSSSKRQKKKASKRLAKEEKIQKAEENRLLKAQQKKAKKQKKKEKKK